MAGSDPLIYRHPLRTEQFELKQLNGESTWGLLTRIDYSSYRIKETYEICPTHAYRPFIRIAW